MNKVIPNLTKMELKQTLVILLLLFFYSNATSQINDSIPKLLQIIDTQRVELKKLEESVHILSKKAEDLKKLSEESNKIKKEVEKRINELYEEAVFQQINIKNYNLQKELGNLQKEKLLLENEISSLEDRLRKSLKQEGGIKKLIEIRNKYESQLFDLLLYQRDNSFNEILAREKQIYKINKVNYINLIDSAYLNKELRWLKSKNKESILRLNNIEIDAVQ